MIKDIIYRTNRDNFHVNGLSALHKFSGKIASFSLYEKATKLGFGQGIVLYEGKKPTGQEIQKFVEKKKQELYARNHIQGNFLDPKYSQVRFIQILN